MNDDENSDVQSGDEDNDALVFHIMINEPLSKLKWDWTYPLSKSLIWTFSFRKLIEQSLGNKLHNFEFWLQDSQQVSVRTAEQFDVGLIFSF